MSLHGLEVKITCASHRGRGVTTYSSERGSSFPLDGPQNRDNSAQDDEALTS